MHRLLFLIVLLAALGGCAIPVSGVRPDGVVVIEVVAPRAFRVGGQLFFESDLETALEKTTDESVKGFEVRVPKSLLTAKDGRDGCGSLAQVMVAAHKPWKAFAWAPRDESTLQPIFCDVIVLS